MELKVVIQFYVVELEALCITHVSKSFLSFVDELQLPNKGTKSVDFSEYRSNCSSPVRIYIAGTLNFRRFRSTLTCPLAILLEPGWPHIHRNMPTGPHLGMACPKEILPDKITRCYFIATS